MDDRNTWLIARQGDDGQWHPNDRMLSRAEAESYSDRLVAAGWKVAAVDLDTFPDVLAGARPLTPRQARKAS